MYAMAHTHPHKIKKCKKIRFEKSEKLHVFHMVEHTYDPSLGEVETEAAEAQAHPATY